MKKVYEDIKRANRIVVKVGTSTLTYDTGKMNLKRINQLAMILSDLRNQGREIILVSSGCNRDCSGKAGAFGKAAGNKAQTGDCGCGTV